MKTWLWLFNWLFWLIVLVMFSVGLFLTPWWVTTGCLVLFCGIILALANINVFFTVVKEGTAKIVTAAGQFNQVLIRWDKHTLDKEWNVVPTGPFTWSEKEPLLDDEGKLIPDKDGKPQAFSVEKHGYHRGQLYPLGGLMIYGLWPLYWIYKYNFRWRDVQLVKGEKEEAKFNEKKKMDYIFIRPDVYWTDIKDAETKPPERVPLSIQFLVTMRVINPYKALFRAPSNWNENVMFRLNALFRAWVGTKNMDEILALRSEGADKIWAEFAGDPLIVMFESEWGVKVEEEGIELRDVGLDPKLQEAAASQREMALRSAGRASEIIGTAIEMVARIRGIPTDKPENIAKLSKLLEEDEDLKKDLLKTAKDLLLPKLAMENKSYVKIDVDGAGDIETFLLNLLAAWQRMPQGGGGKSSGSSDEEEETKPKKTKEQTEKDFSEAWKGRNS